MAQILKKFIGDNQVADEKIRLDYGGILRARNAGNTADVDILQVSGADKVQILDGSALSIDATDRILRSSDGDTAVNYDNRKLVAPGNVIVIDYNSATQVDINANLVPGSDDTRDLGSPSNRFSNLYAVDAYDGSSNPVIGFNARTLHNSSGIQVLNFSGSSDITISKNFIPDADATYSLGVGGSGEFNDVYASSFGSNDSVVSFGAGDANVTFQLNSYGSGTVAPRLGFTDYTNGFRAYIKAPDTLAADYTLTLPADDGTPGQVLETNGSGVLSWVTPSAGAPTWGKQTFTLSAGDITNGYIDFTEVATTNSVQLLVKGAGVMLEGASHHFTLNYTGGAGGNTRLTWLNELATGGAAELVAGDIIQVVYTY